MKVDTTHLDEDGDLQSDLPTFISHYVIQVHQAVRNRHSVALVEPAYGSDVEQPWLTARQPQRSGRVARSEKARAVHLNGADGPHHCAAPRVCVKAKTLIILEVMSQLDESLN